PIAAPLAQVLIRSIDEVSAQPFVAVSRARGASTWWLLWRTVARNALLPTLTMAGLLFGELVGGAVVTETVFARMGIGQLTAQAVAARDTPVLMAVVVLSTVVFVLINLIVDLIYPVLDARLLSTCATAPTRTAPAADPDPVAGPGPAPRPAPGDRGPAPGHRRPHRGPVGPGAAARPRLDAGPRALHLLQPHRLGRPLPAGPQRRPLVRHRCDRARCVLPRRPR